MKRTLLSLATLTASVMAIGQQARIVMNNAAGPIYMVFNQTNPSVTNQTWLVIDHDQTTGLSLNTPALPGGIRSEDEFNMIRWRTSNVTNAVTYTVPFNSPIGGGNGVNIPFQYTKQTTGVGTGSTVFATYNFGSFAPSWNNYVYRPSDVTHVSDDPTGSTIDSGADEAVDRFWIVDTKAAGYAYTTSPDAVLQFTNADAEITTGNSFANTDPLNAQRFNFTNLHWGDYFPGGVWVPALAGTHTVTTPMVPNGQFYRSWTLSDAASPLPVELTAFAGNCVDSRVELKWTTASEVNNSHFEVEKSNDGATWSVIGTVNGNGNSQETIHYSFVDAENTGNTAYYRLKQVDNNGDASYTTVINAGCDVPNGTELVNVWDNGAEVQLMVSSTVDGVYDVVLMDANSKAISTLRNQQISKGITYLSIPKSGIAMGVYMVRMLNQSEQFSRKVVLN